MLPCPDLFLHELLRRASDRILAVALYGSAARGDRDPLDIDMLVVVGEDAENLVGIVERTRVDVEQRCGRYLSVNLISLSRLLERLDDCDPLLIAALREGVPLYNDTLIYSLKLYAASKAQRCRPDAKELLAKAHNLLIEAGQLVWHAQRLLFEACLRLKFVTGVAAIVETGASALHEALSLNQRLRELYTRMRSVCRDVAEGVVPPSSIHATILEVGGVLEGLSKQYNSQE